MLAETFRRNKIKDFKGVKWLRNRKGFSNLLQQDIIYIHNLSLTSAIILKVTFKERCAKCFKYLLKSLPKPYDMVLLSFPTANKYNK